MIFKPLYPGNLWVNTPEIDTSDLEKITHFDSMEISALYEQFLAFSTVDQDGGIPRKTFESLFGTVQVKGNLLVDRIFKFFDQDLDGIISFDEMVRGMSILTKGSREEKINCKYFEVI
jgi:Ca2+-binding EF-hand superfamily protein